MQSKLAYEQLMELPLLHRLLKRIKLKNEQLEDSEEEEEEEEDTGEDRLQTVFLAKLRLCSMTVEKLAITTGDESDSDSQTNALLKSPPTAGYRRLSRLSEENLERSPTNELAEKGGIEYSASPKKRLPDESEAVDKRRIENALRTLKKKAFTDGGELASSPTGDNEGLISFLRKTTGDESPNLPTGKSYKELNEANQAMDLPRMRRSYSGGDEHSQTSQKEKFRLATDDSDETPSRAIRKKTANDETEALRTNVLPERQHLPNPIPSPLAVEESNDDKTEQEKVNSILGNQSSPFLYTTKARPRPVRTSYSEEGNREMLGSPVGSPASRHKASGESVSPVPSKKDVASVCSPTIGRRKSDMRMSGEQLDVSIDPKLSSRDHVLEERGKSLLSPSARNRTLTNDRPLSPSSRLAHSDRSGKSSPKLPRSTGRSKRTSALLERYSAEYLAKQVKRECLLELVTFVNDNGFDALQAREECSVACVQMVQKNLFRKFAPVSSQIRSQKFDVDEDTPILDPQWPHISVVYEFLIRLLSSQGFSKTAVDGEFCARLIGLFRTEDPREREYLKNSLHRIYGKFPSLRPTIRRHVHNTFEMFVNERGKHPGILELLEVVGSIVSGFSVPLKREHLEFVQTALLPLHRADSVALFHNQLTYCMTQIVEKDVTSVIAITRTLRKYFPWSAASKQLLFLNELEETMEIALRGETSVLGGKTLKKLIPAADLNATMNHVGYIVQECLRSQHFQVVERALFLWNNDSLVNHFFKPSLARMKAIFLGVEAARNHWNSTVRSLAEDVAQLYDGEEHYEQALLSVNDNLERGKNLEILQRSRIWQEISLKAHNSESG